MLVSGPIFGWLSDNVSRRLVVAVRGIANTVSSILYAVMPTATGFFLAKAIDSLGAAAFKPAWGVMMVEAAEKRGEDWARVMGVMGAGRDVGTLLGPVIGGILWTLFGPVTMLLTRAALALGTEVYAHIVLYRQAASKGLLAPESTDDERLSASHSTDYRKRQVKLRVP